jgi:anti-sigma regulatory factor (Ser/Thr protein kinase)
MPNDRPRGLPTVGEGCTTILGPGKSSVRQARELVRKRLAEYGLQDLVDIAELLVSELATNAVVHAGGRYRLTLSLGVGSLRCEVADERRHLPRPPHRQAESDAHLDVDPDSENGRGLFLVDALAHRWGSRLVDEGKEVWFELEIQAPDGMGDAATAGACASAPAPTRPQLQEAHGRAELCHERTDHGYSADGDRTADLGLRGRYRPRRRVQRTASGAGRPVRLSTSTGLSAPEPPPPDPPSRRPAPPAAIAPPRTRTPRASRRRTASHRRRP